MLTADRLREVLAYDPTTGVFTRRQGRDGRGKPHKAGDVAGSTNGKGYVFIRVDSGRYSAHRLAWLYVHGVWPSCDVDHRNQARGDNRIENLRLASDEQNLQNVRKRRTNTSGYKGVSHRARHPHRPWRATIRFNGKQIDLGFFATAEEAHAVRSAKAIECFGEFARNE